MSKKVTIFPPFSITETALKEIEYILKTKKIPANYGLRVGVKGGAGCGGVDYILGFDTPKEEDDVFDFNGLSVYMEKKHAMFLAGKKIDFEDTAEQRGFVFN